MVSVKFNDEHIPDSPFRVPVLPSSGDARKVTVQALKQKGLEVCGVLLLYVYYIIKGDW